MDKPASPKDAASVSPAPPLLGRIISMDAAVSEYLHTVTRPFLPHNFLRLLELLADFRFFFPVALSIFLYTPRTSSFHNDFLFPLILCSLLDLVLIGILKSVVRRSRPLYNHSSKYNAVVSVDHFSFPSGHSSRVWFIASLFYLSRAAVADEALVLLKARGSESGLFGLIFMDQSIGGYQVKAVDLLVLVIWSWATVTCLSRILLGRHFVLDVLVGAALGVLEAVFTFCFLRL